MKSRWATGVHDEKHIFYQSWAQMTAFHFLRTWESSGAFNPVLLLLLFLFSHIDLTATNPAVVTRRQKDGTSNREHEQKQGKVDMCVYDAYRDGLIRAQRSEDCGVHVWTPTFAHPRSTVGFGSLIFVKRLDFLLFSTMVDEFRWSGRHRHHGQLVRQAEPRSRVRNMVGRRSHAMHFVHSACLPDVGVLVAGSSQRGIMTVDSWRPL